MSNPDGQFATFVSKYLYEPDFKKRADVDLPSALQSLGVEITAQVQAAMDAFRGASGAFDMNKFVGAVNNSFVGMD